MSHGNPRFRIFEGDFHIVKYGQFIMQHLKMRKNYIDLLRNGFVL
jgi:hypothetical protein